MLTKAMAADLDRLTELYRASIGLPGCTWSENYPTREDAALDIAENRLWAVRDEHGIIIAALSLEEDEVRPFDFCLNKDGASMCLCRVVVDRAHQGRGLAGQMVAELLNIMRDQGYAWLRLLVSPNNKPAMATYRKLGFQPIGECDLYETHWLACELKL